MSSSDFPQWVMGLLSENGEPYRLSRDYYEKLEAYCKEGLRRARTLQEMADRQLSERYNSRKSQILALLNYNRRIHAAPEIDNGNPPTSMALTAPAAGEPEVEVPRGDIEDLSKPQTNEAKRRYTKNAQQKIAEHWAEVKKSGNEELIGQYLTGAEEKVAKQLFKVSRNTLRESEFYKSRDEEAADWRRRNSKPPSYISDL